MKRTLFIAALMCLALVSCNKYEASMPLDIKSIENKIAVSGYVYADLDETTVALEPVPVGTIVSLSVPYSDYTLSGSGNSGNYIITSTVMENGAFDFLVPVISSGVNATISFEDFVYVVNAYNVYGDVEEYEKHFSCNDIVLNGLGSAQGEGDHIKIDVQYSADQINPNDDIALEPTHEVTFSGKLTYDSEAGAPATVVPGGTELKATITLTGPAPANKTYKVVKEFTVGASGSYSIDIPMVERGRASIKVDEERFWSYSDGTNDFIYRYTLSFTESVYNSNYNKKDYKYTRAELINTL